MEFPNSSHFGANQASSYDTAQAFLDSERGSDQEIITTKKVETKDLISDQSGSVLKNINSNGDGTLTTANLNGNTMEQQNKQGNKERTNQNFNSRDQGDIFDEQDKFKEFNSKEFNEASSVEDKKFTNRKSKGEKYTSFDFVDDNKNRKNENDSKEKNGSNISSKPGSPNEDQEERDKEEWMDILGSGQLKKKTLKHGISDSRPQKSDVCEISLIGKLEDNTIFDEHKCLEINLGDNETVQGLDFVLALMDKGEEAEVIVASRFGYGSLGHKPHVPPDAKLYYHITLLDVKQEPLISTLDINERIAIGNRKKERGNWWYTRDEHTLAIHSYRRALDYLDDTDIPGEHTDEQVRLLIDDKLKTYNNLGISQMKIFAYDAALISIDHVLNCQPKNVKALFRKSKILKEKGELSKSIEVIRQALGIEPDSKGLQQELSLLLAAQRKDNSKQRDLYKKMMGHSLQDNDPDKKKKVPYNAFRWIAALSFAVAIIGAVAFKYRL